MLTLHVYLCTQLCNYAWCQQRSEKGIGSQRSEKGIGSPGVVSHHVDIGNRALWGRRCCLASRVGFKRAISHLHVFSLLRFILSQVPRFPPATHTHTYTF